MLAPNEEVIVNVSPAGQSGGFNAITDLSDNSELGLFASSSFGSTDPDVYLDFVTWGGITNPTRAQQAVDAGRWDDANSFVAGAAPFTYLGGANDVGADFWVGNTEIRITLINPKNDIVVIENVDDVALDISDFFFCTLAGVYPRLGNPDQVEVLEGDLYLRPGKKIAVRVLTEGGVVDEEGSLFLFSTNVLGFNNSNPYALRDFAQWDAPNGFRVDNAVAAGRWDNASNFIEGNEPYFVRPLKKGSFGSEFWRARNASVRFVEIDLKNDKVTLKNFGRKDVNLAGYFFCLEVGQYQEIIGPDLRLEPGEEIVLKVDAGLDDVNPDNIGLFSKDAFRSTNPNVYVDFAQWGGRDDDGRPTQAVFAGIWENANAFISGAAPFSFVGGIDDFGSQNWEEARAEGAFTLFDAIADKAIQSIIDGDVIDLNLLPTTAVNVVVNFDGIDDIHNVVLELNGKEVQTEFFAPFSLFGDIEGDFVAGYLRAGENKIKATAFTSSGATKTEKVEFEVIDTGRLAARAFVLVDADTDEELFQITEGDVIPAEFVPEQANIVVKTTWDVESVYITLNNQFRRVENLAPFALFGDRNGDFSGRPLPAGSHTLYATPFSEDRRGGVQGATLEVNFTIENAAIKRGQDVSILSGFTEEALEELISVPSEIGLEENYPNPFNPQTTIAFSLPEAAQVQLVIYDMLGRQVQTLVDGALSSGRHEVRFEAGDLPSGTYLYRLVTPTQTFVKQMMLVK